jgi:ADP-ribose pyrophosphatase
MPKLGKWKVLSSRDVFDAAPFLKVRVETIELPDGRRIPDYYQLEMPSFACVFAETPEGRIIVYRQYRHGPRCVGLVFPGGHLEPGEAPLDAARRELYRGNGLPVRGLGVPGRVHRRRQSRRAISHMFHATGCRQTANPRSDDLEETEILLLSRTELLAAIGRGEIHLLTQIALVAIANR